MKNTIYPLFPCPLVVCGKKYEFSDAERKFISELEMIDNNDNLMSKNDRVLDEKQLTELRTFIDEQVFNFKKNLLSIRDDNEIYITQSWVNNSNTNHFHPKHKHQNSVISGVLFLDEDYEGLPPDQVSPNAGDVSCELQLR